MHTRSPDLRPQERERASYQDIRNARDLIRQLSRQRAAYRQLCRDGLKLALLVRNPLPSAAEPHTVGPLDEAPAWTMRGHGRTLDNWVTKFNQASSLAANPSRADDLVDKEPAALDEQELSVQAVRHRDRVFAFLWATYPWGRARPRRGAAAGVCRRQEAISPDVLNRIGYGVSLAQSRTPRDLNQARGAVEEAIRLDPDYPEGYGLRLLIDELAVLYGVDTFARWDRGRVLGPVGLLDEYEQDEERLSRIGRREPLNDLAAGVHHLHRHRFDKAVPLLLRAANASRNSPGAYRWLAEALCYLGRFDEALEMIARAQACCRGVGLPLVLATKGFVLYCAGRLPEAERLLGDAVAQRTCISKTHVFAARVCAARAVGCRHDEPQRARELFREGLRHLDQAGADDGLNSAFLLTERACLLAAAGLQDRHLEEQAEQLTQRLKTVVDDHAAPSYYLAQVRAQLAASRNRRELWEQAVDSLAAAVRDRCARAVALGVDPLLTPLREVRPDEYNELRARLFQHAPAAADVVAACAGPTEHTLWWRQ